MNRHQADDETGEVGEHVSRVRHDGQAAGQVATDDFAKFNLKFLMKISIIEKLLPFHGTIIEN